jgi:hypothetical protein
MSPIEKLGFFGKAALRAWQNYCSVRTLKTSSETCEKDLVHSQKPEEEYGLGQIK